MLNMEQTTSKRTEKLERKIEASTTNKMEDNSAPTNKRQCIISIEDTKAPVTILNNEI